MNGKLKVNNDLKLSECRVKLKANPASCAPDESVKFTESNGAAGWSLRRSPTRWTCKGGRHSRQVKVKAKSDLKEIEMAN